MIRPLFVAPLAIAALAATASAQPNTAKLTPADVEKVTGLKGVHIATGPVTGAGPGLNFVGADNKMVLMVNVGPAENYARAKAQKDVTVGGQTFPMPLFHAAVPGVGDEAFDSPPGPMQFVLYVRKGTQAISLSTYPGLGGKKPVISMDQVKEIAKIVVSRM